MNTLLSYWRIATDMLYDPIETIIENSFKNFHSKGLQYLCLRRTPHLTQKVYFFEGDVSKLPEVVNPHDHRYDFETHVLAGTVENRFYCSEQDPHSPYTHFMREWRTPLNGGTGFGDEAIPCFVKVVESNTYNSGQSYFCKATDIHTLQIHADQTVLLLNQFEDRKLRCRPTHTFFETDEKPVLTGLYEKFTADEIISLLRKLGLNNAVDN